MTLALALAPAAKPQPFNADFYSVAATVIPVLFHAIAVQGRIYDEVTTAAKHVARQADVSARRLTGPRRPIGTAAYVLAYIALIMVATPYTASRHAAGGYLARPRVSPAVIAAWLGHADAGFTMKTYVQARPEDLAAARDALAARKTAEE
jgi:integrase